MSAIFRTIKHNESGITVVQTSGFKKELARAKKRGLSSEDFDAVVVMLKNDEPLPPKYKDHIPLLLSARGLFIISFVLQLPSSLRRALLPQ